MENDEKQEIMDIISTQNLNYDDFEFNKTNSTEYASDRLSAITGEIQITYKPSKKSKKYKTGHGTSWLADFEFDLRTNAYGTR